MLRQFGSAGQRVYHTTLFSYGFLLQYWFEPLQNIKQTYTEVYRKALELGDLEYAGFSIGNIPFTLFWYGAPMKDIIADSAIAHQACVKMNQTSALDYVKIFEQTAWNLTNERPDSDSLTGEWYDESEIEISRRIARKSNIVEAYFAKTTLAFFWGKYRTIIDEYAPGFKEYEVYLTASFFIPMQNFFTGMAFFALAHHENEPKHQRIKQGLQRMNILKKLAAIMPFNTQHFYELLQAEHYSATGKMSKAASLYEQAIATAKKNSFQNVVCMAEEAAGRHYLRLGNRTIAEVYLQKAVQSYAKWGVSAKVLQLQREFADFSLRVVQENTPQSSSVQVSGNNGSLDMLSVIKSSQALAGEIELRTLLEKMLTIVKENAGAEKCVVVLNEQHGGQASLFIQAESTGDDVSSVFQHIPLASSSKRVPITLLNAVARLQTSVVLGDASNSADYKNDTYIKQYNVKSVLCNPIVNQGNLVGVMYMENNLVTEAFTPDRIQVLNVLSSQIAVSIENARYYRDIQAMNYTLEQKVQERTVELEKKNKRLTELNKEKNDLMGIVSHDLKNPIGAVRSYAELIYSGMFSGEEALSASGQIVQVSERMLDLVKNLLDMNHLESGGLQMNMVNFDIAPVVEAVVYQYHAPAEAKQITLRYSQESPTNIASADERVLMQVLDNLVSNAVKYSPYGKYVFVRVVNTEHAVRIEIQDEGPGLSEDDKKKLFGKFARLSAQPTGGEHSTGLGLSIVKKMVEAMNGRVWCESELGKGATFIVELPHEKALADGE
jgi:signal transduction histidine kinase